MIFCVQLIKIMSVLQINGLSKSYGKIKALDDLNLIIEPGNVYGILGPNGSGKTTTLGIVLGILSADTGNFSWFEGKYGIRSRMHIGSLLETPNFYPYLDAIDNLDIIRHIKQSDESDFDDVLKLVKLYERRNSKFRTYSLGMKQRLAIASALIGDPDVLIFDEPTNGLDPQGIAEVRETIQSIAATGKTVIMASHILDEVEKICSHVAIIKNGKLLATGTVGSILSHKTQIEIGTTDMIKLKDFVQNFNGLSLIKELPERFLLELEDETDVMNVSETLFNNGFIITQLVTRKKTLEEEFLEITK